MNCSVPSLREREQERYEKVMKSLSSIVMKGKRYQREMSIPAVLLLCVTVHDTDDTVHDKNTL